jgi:hypothetical protein
MLSTRHARWISSGILDYDYVRTWNCFCAHRGMPLRISVRNGQATSITVVTTGQSLAVEYPERETIEGLFRIVADAYASGAARVDVEYDQAHHYPRRVWIDHSTQAADEEEGWQIESFTPVR